MRRPALALFLLTSLVACGQPASPPRVEHVWTRATAGRQATAAVFMTIASSTGDRLVAASTPVAARTDLMTMRDARGAMAMVYVKEIEIPARAQVSLDPGGLHVWLAGLNRPLRDGESFPLTLEFEKAGRREVRVAIIAPAAMPPMPGMEM